MLSLSDEELKYCEDASKGSLTKGIMDILIDSNAFMYNQGIRHLDGNKVDFNTVWNI